jgi:hypothetical protein
MAGEYYKTQVSDGEYPLKFDAEKDLSVPEEYLRKEAEELPNIQDLTITIMGVEREKQKR